MPQSKCQALFMFLYVKVYIVYIVYERDIYLALTHSVNHIPETAVLWCSDHVVAVI